MLYVQKKIIVGNIILHYIKISAFYPMRYSVNKTFFFLLKDVLEFSTRSGLGKGTESSMRWLWMLLFVRERTSSPTTNRRPFRGLLFFPLWISQFVPSYATKDWCESKGLAEVPALEVPWGCGKLHLRPTSSLLHKSPSSVEYTKPNFDDKWIFDASIAWFFFMTYVAPIKERFLFSFGVSFIM